MILPISNIVINKTVTFEELKLLKGERLYILKGTNIKYIIIGRIHKKEKYLSNGLNSHKYLLSNNQNHKKTPLIYK